MSQLNYKFLLLFIFFLNVSILSYASISDIEVAVLEQDFDKVEKLSRELLSVESDKNIKNEATYYLGVSLLRRKKYVEAEGVFAGLMRNRLFGTLKDDVSLGLFDAQYLQGNFQEALTTINKLLKARIQSESLSLIYLKAARVNLKLANWVKAREYLKKIISLYPASLEYHSAKQLLEEKQYFSVQVGAFLEKNRAVNLTEELKRRNDYAYIVETVDKNNKTFYRVRVGRFSALNQAQALKTKLASEGYPGLVYP